MLKDLDQFAQFFTVVLQTFVVCQPRRAFRPVLRHAQLNLAHDHVQLQVGRQGGDFAFNLQRVTRHLRQMMPFVQHQQQLLRVRQYRLGFQRRHHQRMVSHHHVGGFNLFTRYIKRAFTNVMAVTAQAVGFIGAQFDPQRIVNRQLIMVAKPVPLMAAKRLAQFLTQRLFFTARRRKFVTQKQHQVALLAHVSAERRQVTRANIAPTAKGTGKFQIGNDLLQQRQILAVDLILQCHVGGADHQRFTLCAADGDPRDQVRQGFTYAGRSLNRQMARVITGQRFCHFGDHLPLRCTGNKIRYLLLQGFVPLANLIFNCGGERHSTLYLYEMMALLSHRPSATSAWPSIIEARPALNDHSSN
ncbi:Uncharacterised protein [Serratia quinivorans]|nr:Uncharacterised protein [Serratia quinivorans]